ncbi:virulence RhuM family protein [Lonepinella sp. BR2271]|uniref:virulence RhuM family protein n=1 Tax=Lonepinella sp. BR2271 TaxID=3434550 RepID=UPI003F6E100A
MSNKSNPIQIYQSIDGTTKVDVWFEQETVWLSQAQMATLFDTTSENIIMHLKNIFAEGELDEDATTKDFLVVRQEGKRQVQRQIKHFNLDAIISVGYRVKSSSATKFRIWATERLKEYLIKGFTMDDERLKNLGGGHYFKELLDRIREIRSSEKVMYRQVLDLYATAIDYDAKSETSIKFFKIVQNKLHYAAHGNTASEVIYFRVDSDKPFAGLSHFKGSQPTQAEAMIAKNYLSEHELRVLNNIVSAYFDFAELNAIEERPMKMTDFVQELDRILMSTNRKVLTHSGSISHDQAIEKAKMEYRKYKARTLDDVEVAYLETISKLGKQAKKVTKK